MCMKKLDNKLVQTDLQTLRTSIICTMVYFSLLVGITLLNTGQVKNYNQNRVLHKDQQDILNYCREERKKKIETL